MNRIYLMIANWFRRPLPDPPTPVTPAVTPAAQSLLDELRKANDEYRRLDGEQTVAWRAMDQEKTPAKEAWSKACRAKDAALDRILELERKLGVRS
jgi:hypothetical protein